MPTKEEILNALTVIKQVCTNTGPCSDCPFRTGPDGTCYIVSTTPHNWEIINEKPQAWKAFAD